MLIESFQQSCLLKMMAQSSLKPSRLNSSIVHGAINPETPCMQDKKSIKRYLKAYLQETQTDNNEYLFYSRCKPKDGGKSTTLIVQGEEMTLDNQWVVPYNKLSCKILKGTHYCEAL